MIGDYDKKVYLPKTKDGAIRLLFAGFDMYGSELHVIYRDGNRFLKLFAKTIPVFSIWLSAPTDKFFNLYQIDVNPFKDKGNPGDVFFYLEDADNE